MTKQDDKTTMKVVLLAAGRSIRMQPVADKNFLKFLGVPLIARQLEALIRSSFDEILIMGGRHNLPALKNLIKNLKKTGKLKKARITLRQQQDLDLGMAGAVISAANWIKADPFLVVSSNDVVGKEAFGYVKKRIKKGEGLLVANKVSKYFPGGYLKISAKGIITKIVEKPSEGKEPSKFVNIVIHYHPFPKQLIEKLKKISSSCDDRYECALQALFDDKIVYRAVPFGGFWQPVKYPWHVITLMDHFLASSSDGARKGRGVEIAKNAVIEGSVILSDGVKVMENAVIKGPAYIGDNSIIATNALVRQSHIGANCVIGFGSEVARSYVGDNVWTHTNYIGDSVIGNDVSFGAGTVTGNLRLDEKNIQVGVNGGKMDCGSNKFGLVTGNHIRVGINASFMPGIKIGSNSFVGAGIVVAQDIPEGSYVAGRWELKIRPNKEKITPRNPSSHNNRLTP